MRVGVATLHHGRREHLERQARAVAGLAGVDRYLAVAMDDSPPPLGAEGLALATTDPARLPLAAARNAAIAALGDCDLVVLLDADCLPDPELIDAFTGAAATLVPEDRLLLGAVGWLERDPPEGRLDPATVARARATVKRSFPVAGREAEPRPELFWSLCAAVSPAAHRRIGGFDEGFAGWGAEDTDYGRRAVAAGLALWKVGGAWAYHQPHARAATRPEQLPGIVANARRFHARWGDWPIPDLLDELARDGRVRWDPGAGVLTADIDCEP